MVTTGGSLVDSVLLTGVGLKGVSLTCSGSRSRATSCRHVTGSDPRDFTVVTQNIFVGKIFDRHIELTKNNRWHYKTCVTNHNLIVICIAIYHLIYTTKRRRKGE